MLWWHWGFYGAAIECASCVSKYVNGYFSLKIYYHQADFQCVWYNMSFFWLHNSSWISFTASVIFKTSSSVDNRTTLQGLVMIIKLGCFQTLWDNIVFRRYEDEIPWNQSYYINTNIGIEKLLWLVIISDSPERLSFKLIHGQTNKMSWLDLKCFEFLIFDHQQYEPRTIRRCEWLQCSFGSLFNFPGSKCFQVLILILTNMWVVSAQFWFSFQFPRIKMLSGANSDRHIWWSRKTSSDPLTSLLISTHFSHAAAEKQQQHK